MSNQPPQPVSQVRELIIATVVGVAAGVISDNLIVGTAVGIVLGLVLTTLKSIRHERRNKP